MTIMVAGCTLALAVAAMGSLAVGKIVAEKKDAQRAADAAVLAVASAVEQLGLPLDANKLSQAELIAKKNSKRPVSFTWQVNPQPDRVMFSVTATVGVPMPGILFPGGNMMVTSKASGEFEQQVFTDAHRAYPRFVLVMDYSGSMSQPMVNGGGSAISELRTAVHTLLNMGLKVKYGAVLFDDTFDTVPLGLGTEGQIGHLVDQRQPGSITATDQALDKARGLFDAVAPIEDEEKFLLLVTDGQPTDADTEQQAQDSAFAAAQRLWADDVTIFTLQIEDTAGSYEAPELRKFIRKISGEPGSGGNDPNYAADVTSGQDLSAQFQAIAAQVACPVKVGSAVTDPSHMYVLLHDPHTGDETALGDAIKAGASSIRDLGDEHGQFYNKPFYIYRADKQKIYVSEWACDRIMNNQAELVLRQTAPRLTQ
jgi:Mg-chelatase subunit ChlD